MDIFYLIFGLVLVVVGANVMTDGASGIAGRFGLSEFIVGATVIAIGTSSPELVVSMLSAMRGETAIAIGNVVGSNMFNTLVIVGVTAIIMPLPLTDNNVRKDIPFGVLATVVLIFCAADVYLGDGPTAVIGRSEGWLLLCFFAVFMAYTIYSQSAVRCAPAGGSGASQETYGTTQQAAGVGETKRRKMWVLVLMTVGGIAGLLAGGELFLNGAVAMAQRFGISDTVIAVTIVAGGTSLPELAASVVAAVKRKPGIALGNILGSNVMNIFLVLGASAAVSPLQMGDITMGDLFAVFVAAVLIFVAAFTFRSRRIDRIEGVIFLLLYIGYIVWLLKR